MNSKRSFTSKPEPEELLETGPTRDESGTTQDEPHFLSDDQKEPVAAIVRNHGALSHTINQTLLFPIINVGLPKSGEDTLWNFFHKLGLVTQHGCGHVRRPRNTCIAMGPCIYANVQNERPAFTNCSKQIKIVDPNERELQVYTQLDGQRYLSHQKPVKTGQYVPQIQYLNELYSFQPNATWILPLHLPQHWAFTVSRHHMLRKRLWNEGLVAKHHSSVPVRNRSIFQEEPNELDALDHWERYYHQHTTRIRDFVQDHPSLRLIEVQYRFQRAPFDLMDRLGLPLSETMRAFQERGDSDQSVQLSDFWECLSNECDTWTENLQSIDAIRNGKTSATGQPPLKLETPIFVVGMPKSGTTSVFNFFSCAGVVSQHYCCCGDVSDHRPCYSPIMADCIMDNKKNGRPMLENCGDYDVYGELDGEQIYSVKNATNGMEEKLGGHFLPQVFELDWIHKEYPNATLILPLRNSKTWAASVSRWFNMRHRIQNEYIYMNRSEEVVNVGNPLVNLYEKHTTNIVKFVQEHPSHKLILFEITDPNAGKVLADASGLPEHCWGHHNQNTERKY